jgi:L-lactate dehydrogenase complex protein LldE
VRPVALFVTCLVDQLFPHIGECTVRVLERAGCAVSFPPAQTCCGQATFNDGFQEQARSLARQFLDVFEGAPAIVAPSGSCVAMVREWYPQLFEESPALHERVQALAHRTYELSEYLVRVLGQTDLGARFPAAVAYHPSCHGLRGLGLREEPLRLLAAVRDLRLVELPRADECCGFGGFFSVKFAGVSGAML